MFNRETLDWKYFHAICHTLVNSQFILLVTPHVICTNEWQIERVENGLFALRIQCYSLSRHVVFGQMTAGCQIRCTILNYSFFKGADSICNCNGFFSEAFYKILGLCLGQTIVHSFACVSVTVWVLEDTIYLQWDLFILEGKCELTGVTQWIPHDL